MNKIKIDTPYIKLDSAMKLAGAAGTGGQAKIMISESMVSVNGEVCLMRGKKLYDGDSFEVNMDGVKLTYEIKNS